MLSILSTTDWRFLTEFEWNEQSNETSSDIAQNQAQA